MRGRLRINTIQQWYKTPTGLLNRIAAFQRNILMMTSKVLTAATFLTLTLLACLTPHAHAAQCGNGPAGFETWKQQFAGEARAKGVGANGLSALMAANYAQATINADRSLHSFKLSLDQFMVKRGAAAVVARGRGMKQRNAALFASIEQRYGVPAGPLIAIWG